MTNPIKTIQISLYPRDVHRLLEQNAEYPDVFVIKNIDQHDRVVLEHHIDGSDTSLLITLNKDGTWTALKHVEV